MEFAAFKHETYGYLTVDFDGRRAAVGLVTPRRHNSLVEPADYQGRGWRDRLLSDAMKRSEELFNTGVSH